MADLSLYNQNFNRRSIYYMHETRYKREHSELAALLRRCGIQTSEIIRLLGVTPQIFERWQKAHRELREALQEPTTADQAEAALLKRALGFQVSEESSEELVDKKTGELLEVLKKRTITKDVPPDVRALLFYLKNRHPERWGDDAAERSYSFTPDETEADL